MWQPHTSSLNSLNNVIIHLKIICLRSVFGISTDTDSWIIHRRIEISLLHSNNEILIKNDEFGIQNFNAISKRVIKHIVNELNVLRSFSFNQITIRIMESAIRNYTGLACSCNQLELNCCFLSISLPTIANFHTVKFNVPAFINFHGLFIPVIDKDSASPSTHISS